VLVSAYAERRRARWIVVPLGVLLIVAPVLYGVLTLISPLPEPRTVQTGFAGPTAFDAVKIPLPEGGASAVVGPDGTLLDRAGSEAPVPMAGAAKTLLVLASLDARPLREGEDGDVVAITAADVRYFDELAGTGARVNRVAVGSTWTQRDVIRAVMVGGSNNHARTLARWAFGSEEEYIVAAEAWAKDNGLTGTSVVDPTGLPAENTATAADLARLAWLAGQSPALHGILAEGAGGQGDNPVTDNLSYRADAGVTAISRGYTDAAGVCLLFSVPLDAADDGPRAVYAAFSGQPDYPSLSASVDGFVAAAPDAVTPVTIVEEGDEVARVESAWGQTSSLVAARTVTVLGFAGELPAGTVDAVPPGFPVHGQPAGNLLIDIGGERERIGLRSEGSIRDPGLFWRVTHPAELLQNLLAG
jgi:D-alanyl-D-alanine carboxypeptidase (penicillin-binding protein 5/6)